MSRGAANHCSFIADPCKLSPASEPIMLSPAETVALAAVATMPATPPTSRPYPARSELEPLFVGTPTPNICVQTPRSAGFSVTRRFSAVVSEVNTFEPPSSASYRSQTLRISSASLQSLEGHEHGDYSRTRGTYPRMISMARTRIHGGRGPCGCPLSAGSVSPSDPTILISSMRKTSDSVFSSPENCLSSKKTTRVARSVSGKFGLSDRALSSSGER